MDEILLSISKYIIFNISIMQKITKQIIFVSCLGVIIYCMLILLRVNVEKKWLWTFGLNFEDGDDLEKRMIGNLTLFIGLYFTFHITLIALTRISTLKILPYEGKEPRIIQTLNRVLGNTIEQFIIFFSMLTASYLLKPINWPLNYYVQLMRMFIFGRIFFSAGYIIGQIVSFPYLRAVGFAFTAFSSLFMIGSFAGIDIFTLIQNIETFDL